MVNLANAVFNLAQVVAVLAIFNELWRFSSFYWRLFLKRQYQARVAPAEHRSSRKKTKKRKKTSRRRRSPSPNYSSDDGYSNSYSGSDSTSSE